MYEFYKKILLRDLEILKNEVKLTENSLLYLVPNGVTNSIGNLSLHLCGNLRHFIGSVIGGSGYVRDRDKEFSDRSLMKSKIGR